MAKGLTKRQEEILACIRDYVAKEGFPPSIREIGKQFEIGSLRGVTVHLDALERKGYINRSNTPRSIKVVHPEFQPNAGILQLPLLGTIAAGQPILAEEHVDAMIPVPPGMVKDTDNAFLLRVIGDSMIGDGILESDLVVIRPQTNARNMDIVAFLLGDEATVKRINYEPNGSIKLLSSNPKYAPIPVDREGSRVIGKVVGLIRDYEGRSF
ncbi:LexA SOS-response transcriptional repressors (RecA-mediated autopeptidases) [Fimbriimonadaceae bacterium]|jgi:repressor LexA